MKSRTLTCITAMTLFAVLAVPLGLAAQDETASAKEVQHHHYQLIDLGTLGGPASNLGPFSEVILNEAGTVVGGADTSTRDPNYPNFNPGVAPSPQDPFIQHAFQWQNGILADLGALSGTNSSYVNWVNSSGVAAGNSENGSIDPITGWPEIRAVVWQAGRIIDLGTFGGNESSASAINKQGWVVGLDTNSTPDTLCLGLGTQCRAFLWDQKNGKRDLGALYNANDAFAVFVNDLGQVAGISLIDPTDPYAHAFLWENGQMQDLGTLGGHYSQPNYLNNRGQVVGYSTLAGDTVTHPYLWDQKHGMRDLGTLGGTFASPSWINEAGEIVGEANHAGDIIHTAFLWNNGEMKELGVVQGDKCSSAYAINSKGQIVGASGDCNVVVHAFLWENGHMIDLTRLVPPGVELLYGIDINDRGEIAAIGKIPNTFDVNFYTNYDHAFLLVPCDENHPDVEGCSDGGAGAAAGQTPGESAEKRSRRDAHSPVRLTEQGILRQP